MSPAVTEPPLLYGLIAGIVIAFGILVVVVYRKWYTRTPVTGENTSQIKAGRLAYQPEARPIPAIQPSAIPRPVVQKSPGLPKPKDVSILNGRNDISESMLALVDKYSLNNYTIATSDGLVFASAGSDSAPVDAARYSEIFQNDPLSETPGVVLAGISHKGSDLVLIISTPLPVPEPIMQEIENDTKDILNWWV